ncbi:hypothetical protein Hena1_02150 [Erwinia phage Hena1]|uniref:Uncharacterized protein n=1 Tax=Erwinia phage Hena1 TaxID=2678601 RepID=A0A6B9J613_9CAUD|nr:hypothetical protein HWC84_gp149 [Erwinia phage Hena1]QGZ16365.1 hypothetical protein Hena1_02150 [Erwinia phage Hena1]
MKNKPQTEIFVIFDTEHQVFWRSANEKVSWSSKGVAKTAFSSSRNNTTKRPFAEQTRYKLASVDVTGIKFIE